MRKAVMIAVLVALVGAAALAARGQATQRPGDATQAVVLVQNRNPNEAIPVLVQSVAGITHVRISGVEPDVVLPVREIRQSWEYRTLQTGPGFDGGAFNPAGMQGWEAVGIVQTSPSGATVLFKRAR